MYTYNCKVLRVVDGDTVEVEIDLGLYVKITRMVRLLGINAPEMNTPEGPKAKEHLEVLLAGNFIVIQTHLDRNDKYGRLLGTFFIATVAGTNINKRMIDDGFARVM